MPGKTFTEVEVNALDRRRQAQITNQVEVINRLLDDATYDEVMRETQEALAAVTVERDDALRRVAELEAKHGV